MIWVIAILLTLAAVQWNVNRRLNRELDQSILLERAAVHSRENSESKLRELEREVSMISSRHEESFSEKLRLRGEKLDLEKKIVELQVAGNFNPNEPTTPWDSNDVSVLAGFLKSQTGQRLLGNLSMLREQYVRESLHSKTKGEFTSGRASGWSVCVTYIRRSAISAPSEPQSDETESGQPQPMMGRHVLTTLGESSK